jgi:hypothetical protein
MMDELDNILITRKVNLDGGYASADDDRSESGMSDGSGYLWREKYTESMIRNDAFAPHVVHFTPTYNPQKRARRLAVFLLVLILSASAIFHLRKLVRMFEHEAYLDIEVKMDAIGTETSSAP